MNTKKPNKSIVDTLVILAVFCVFALTALFVVLFGARIYRNNVDNMSDNFDKRTGVLYITERIQANDEGDFSVISSDSTDVFVMSTHINSEVYNTYLYVYDGSLCEYTGQFGKPFNLSYGEKILPAESLAIEMSSPDIVHFTLSFDDGYEAKFATYLKSIGGSDEF